MRLTGACWEMSTCHRPISISQHASRTTYQRFLPPLPSMHRPISNKYQYDPDILAISSDALFLPPIHSRSKVKLGAERMAAEVHLAKHKLVGKDKDW